MRVMTTTLRARFDGRVFVPTEPVDVPKGAEFTLRIEPAAPTETDERPLARLGEALDRLSAERPPSPEGRTDGAAQHDHYLYGTPKRQEP
jgi:hypothetical protein